VLIDDNRLVVWDMARKPMANPRRRIFNVISGGEERWSPGLLERFPSMNSCSRSIRRKNRGLGREDGRAASDREWFAQPDTTAERSSSLSLMGGGAVKVSRLVHGTEPRADDCE